MGKEAFITRAFSPSSLAIIDQANDIIVEYQEQGFSLTLRQLYYQFVSRDFIENKQSEYKRLGSIINDARLTGMIDWDAIEDRTRYLRQTATWDSPSEILSNAAAGYREDLWLRQRYQPEVWIEKDALVGVIEGICREWRVPYFACRGYSSQSEQYAAGKRFELALSQNKQPIVLHLGDHDPSGIDMTRDNESRLSMFAYEQIPVRRLALNYKQVERYRPPPNPAKETDSRSGAYIAQFGNKSWELDALEPSIINDLIALEIESLIDRDIWDEDMARETAARARLERIATEWQAETR